MRIASEWKVMAGALALLAIALGAANAADDGVVKGTVTIPTDAGSVRDTVVYLEGSIGSPTPKNGAMDQRDVSFVPHVLPIVVGSTVEFPNHDKVMHNVFSASAPKKFDLGVFKPGESRSVTFDKPGVVEVLCNVHPKMQGFVVVLSNAYFAQPDAQGNFEISGIPTGRYKLIAWHDGLAPLETWLNLEEAKMRSVDLKMHR